MGPLTEREQEELRRIGPAGRRAVLFVPDLARPARSWQRWRERFERAGHPTFAPEPPVGLELDADRPERVAGALRDRMEQLIDRMPREPFVVGAGVGALAALRLDDDLASAGTVAVGGPGVPLRELGVDPENPFGPLLLIGGEDDPELPVDALRDRYRAYLGDDRPDEDRLRLLVLPGSAHDLAFGAGWERTADAALRFLAGPTRTERARRFLADLWDSIVR